MAERSAEYGRGYGDCAVMFLEKLIEAAKACEADAQAALDARELDKHIELRGGASALKAFVRGFAEEALRKRVEAGHG